MVTFQNMGRLGNFLFEAATTYAYAQKHNLRFTVPSKTNNPFWDPIYLQHLVKAMPKLPEIRVMEKGHQYQELPFKEEWQDKNIILQGYFQSEKYFEAYRPEILHDFAFQWNPHNNVSIHVRRGDYLKYPYKHPVVPDEFYENAINYFVDKGFTDFYVYSDDLEWCFEYFFKFKNRVKIIYSFGGKNHEQPEVDDLIGISNCAGGHINSSSTFAWWGAWLDQNPNKIVITPKLWFMPGHGNLDVSDIVPETWIKM